MLQVTLYWQMKPSTMHTSSLCVPMLSCHWLMPHEVFSSCQYESRNLDESPCYRALFLLWNVRQSYLQIVGRDEDSFSMDCNELLSFSPQLYRSLVAYPREVIPVLDDVLNNLAAAIRRAEAGGAAHANGAGGDTGSQMDAQPPAEAGPQAINIRPYNLADPRAIRDLDPNDIEALVQIDGLVTRVSNVMPDLRYVLVLALACVRLFARISNSFVVFSSFRSLVEHLPPRLAPRFRPTHKHGTNECCARLCHTGDFTIM